MPKPKSTVYFPEGRAGGARHAVRFDYKPFAHTARLHLAFGKYRERVAVTGARGGKTTAGVADVRDKAIDQPGFNVEDKDRGEPYSIFIGAPDFPTIKRVILPAFLRSIPASIIAKSYNHTDHLLKLHGRNGITDIYFMTGKFPDTWQGVKAYGIWLDEFARLKEGMYDEARTRLMDRQGWLLMTGTPQGPNWAHDRIYVPWKDGKRPDVYFTTWPTVENERLPAGFRSEIERHRQTMPKKYFARTYEASWDVFEGQVYEEWSDAVHVVSGEEFMFISKGRNVGMGKKVIRLNLVVAGVDWGSTKDHKGVIIVLGRSIQGTWYVLEESVAPYGEEEESILVRGRTLAEDSWTKRALTLRAKWRIDVFYGDPARPENLRMFREAGLPIEPALNAVHPGIQAVAKAMHVDEDALAAGEVATRFQVLDSCRVLIEELRSYHWDEKKAKEEVVKVMDDTVDALRYALYTAEQREDGGRKPNFDFADRQVNFDLA